MSTDMVRLEGMPPLYHWSPVDRRGQILRYGLRPGMWPTTNGQRWPYVSLAESPSWAWALSGMAAERAGEPGAWDLWMVNVNGLAGDCVPTYDDEHRWHEIRVRERIYKRQLWYVATREVPGA